MKYQNKTTKPIIYLFILILFFILSEQNVILCEVILKDMSPEILLEIKKMLYDSLKTLIETAEFRNKYGRSKIDPIFITHYYTLIICKLEFITNFINSLPIQEIINDTRNSHLFLNDLYFVLLL